MNQHDRVVHILILNSFITRAFTKSLITHCNAHRTEWYGKVRKTGNLESYLWLIEQKGMQTHNYSFQNVI